MPPTFPKTFNCDIILVPQNKSLDCWADVCSAILGWVGVTATQDEVREKILGGDKDEPLPLDGIPKVLLTYGVKCIGPVPPLSYAQLGTELTANPPRPVGIAYKWNPPQVGGHFALVTGYRTFTGRFLVQDPLAGPCELSYAEILLAYGIGEWIASYGGFVKEKS